MQTPLARRLLARKRCLMLEVREIDDLLSKIEVAVDNRSRKRKLADKRAEAVAKRNGHPIPAISDAS